jgi:hypothetical protein
MSVQIGKPQLRLDIEALVRIADNVLETALPLEDKRAPSRLTADDAHIDLWSKERQPLPADAVLVMVHRFFIQVEWFRQFIWFRRTEDRDELWSATIMEEHLDSADFPSECTRPESVAVAFARNTSRVFSVCRQGPGDESLIELLCGFLSTGGGSIGSLESVVATAYISFAQIRLLVQRIELHREKVAAVKARNAELATRNETEIVRVARELGLDPVPSGDGPTAWAARCPNQGHRYVLWLSTKSDQFGCPYCQRKGGVGELIAFAEKEDDRECHA